MGFCANKPPAVVDIIFKDGKKDKVESSDVPIEVFVKKKIGLPTENQDPDSGHGGCCDVTYIIKFSYEACAIGTTPNTCAGETVKHQVETEIAGKMLGTKITQFQGTDNAIALTRRGCDGREETFNLLGLSSQKLVSYSIQEIARKDGKPDICTPPDDDEKQCVITVKGAKSGIVYTKEAECPIKFTVGCGGECPPQSLRCKTSAYPGYVCKPCNDFR